MATRLESASRFVSDVHHEAGVGVGQVTVHGQTTLAWNAQRTVVLALEGEIFDTAALERMLGAGQTAAGSHADLLLRLYEKFGEDFAAHLNGAFSVAVWDGAARKMVVVNDRLGSCPLYYARVKDGVLFASGVRALLADPEIDRQVDLVAVYEFVVFDHALDDRTLLESVRLLPQGSVLVCQAGRVTIRPYWTLRYPDRYQPQSEGYYLERFWHYMRQAVARQLPDGRPAAMLLSGGLDSRVIAALLCELGGSVETMTFGIPGCDDARVAAEVAKALGTRHHFFELKPDWLQNMAEEAVRATDGLGNIVNLHVMATLEQQAQSAQVLYKGFLGDALLGWAITRQMWGDYDNEIRYKMHWETHLGHGAIPYNTTEQAKLFTDGFKEQVGSRVCEAYRDGLDKSGSPQLGNQRLYFDLTQRVPRMTLNGVEVARNRAVVRLPFCDNDLVDFVLTVPPGFLFERHLAYAAMIKYQPRMAQIPLEGTGRPLVSCARDVWVQAKRLGAWHLDKVGLGRLLRDEVRPYKNYNGWFRTNLRPWMEDILLAPRTLDRGYFRPDYIRGLVAEHARGVNHAVRIGALLSLELWHRQFVD